MTPIKSGGNRIPIVAEVFVKFALALLLGIAIDCRLRRAGGVAVEVVDHVLDQV
jgi:hypothetical protein